MKNIILISIMLLAVINIFSVIRPIEKFISREYFEVQEEELICRIIKVDSDQSSNINEKKQMQFVEVCEPLRIPSGSIPDRELLDPIEDKIQRFKSIPNVR